MSKVEFISPEGLRLDGRRGGELRQVRVRMGVFERADGSAYVTMGNTRVLAVVYGPREAPTRGGSEHSDATISCEVSLATFSTQERRSRPRGDRRTVDMGVRIAHTLRGAVMTSLYPRSHIDIHVYILQSDGSNAAACINASTLALIDAGVPMRDYVIACTSGFVDGCAILDINYKETSAQTPELTVAVLPKSGRTVLCHMENRVHGDVFDSLLDLATDGCTALYNIMHAAVHARTQDLVPSLGPQ